MMMKSLLCKLASYIYYYLNQIHTFMIIFFGNIFLNQYHINKYSYENCAYSNSF